MIKIAIIGAGLIGKERLKALKMLQQLGREISIVGILDPYLKDLESLAQEYKTKILHNLKETYESRPDWIFIATPHDTVVPILEKITNYGCKILVEKPLGRSLEEGRKITELVKFPDQLFVGFNYRYYAGINSAIKDIKANKFGKLISFNLILGHGGTPEMTKSWKLDLIRAGGGCLIDPGIHLLDLCQIVSNYRLRILGGGTWKGFWNTGIEEECHIILESGGTLINLQVSIVKWLSTFRMEINGTEGYGIVTGRNRSYGKQRYRVGKKWGWLNAKDQKSSEHLILETNGNNVFVDELNALLFGENKTSELHPCTAEEGLSNMELLENCLRSIKQSEGIL